VFRINRRVLTVFLLVGIPVLALGILIVLALGQARLSESFGRHLGEVAQQAATAVDGHLNRAQIYVLTLARTPTLREAVASANRLPLDTAAVERLDEAWRTDGPPPSSAAAVLQTPAGRFLADVSTRDSIYAELLLTDRHGRLIAASNRVSDYFQADEDWWKAAFDDGERGRLVVSDVRWDASARRHAIEISVPVAEPDGDRLGGILKVVTDSREMLGLIIGLRLGATGEALLLRDDGTILFSPHVPTPDTRFYAADQFRTHAAALREGSPVQTGHFRTTAPSGETFVVGVAPSLLAATHPHLSWTVAVMQSEAELLAPVHSLGAYLLAVFALSAVTVLTLALWFSMRLARSPLGADMHLVHHAAVMHVGSTDEPILEGEATEVESR
jgi:hypothetical protein